MQKEYPVIQPAAYVNGFILKIIAIVSMLIDHVGYILYPGQMGFRYIGRLAFPIYVFLLVEGFANTKNVRKYEIRLLVFALISEIPYNLGFCGVVSDPGDQNVFFTLLLGLIMMDVIETFKRKFGDQGIYGIVVELVIVVAFVSLAFVMKTDYSGGGVLLIYCFYRFRDMHLFKYILMALICLLFYVRAEMFAMFAAIPLLMYNGNRGFTRIEGMYSGLKSGPAAQLVRYLFYIFYPAHLLVLHFIAVAIR